MHLTCMALLHLVQFSHPLVASEVMVLVEQPINLYQDYLSPLHSSQFFFSFFLVRFHHLRHALVLCLTSMSNVHQKCIVSFRLINHS